MKTPHAYLIWMWRSNTQKQHIISSICEWYIMISYAAKSCTTKRMVVKPFSMGCGYHPQPFRMDQASWQVVHWPTLRWAYLGVFASEVEGVAKKQGNTPPQYSGKIDQNWAFDLVFTMLCVYHHSRPRTAKVRKTGFSSRAAWVSSLYGYVGRRTGISIPTNVAWRVCASARGTCSSVAWLVCRSILERYY